MAWVERIELIDFRNWSSTVFSPGKSGITAIVGDNGHGKTNLIEAVFYASTGGSFRSSTKDVLIRSESESSILHAIVTTKGRELTIDCSINRSTRDRHLVNKKQVPRISDLRSEIPVIEFNPDDLQLVKGSPMNRRTLLDDFLSMLSRSSSRLVDETDRILKQRAALLKSANRSTLEEVNWSLDVWDRKLAYAGTDLADRRESLVLQLQPLCAELYKELSGGKGEMEIHYSRSWKGDLESALIANRDEDLRRQQTGVGPHRDDLLISLGGMAARLCASQGEQRTISYVLKAGMCLLLNDQLGEPPVILLDDILSELDSTRARSVLEVMPEGQVLLTATSVPASVKSIAEVLRVVDGRFADV